MLKNILKISLRNFLKERFYATINISGLALGIATSLLIISYVIHETSYDTTHPDIERLYRVNMTNIWMPKGGVMSSSVPPLAHVLSTEYPEIEQALRINTPGGNIIRREKGNDKLAFYEDNVLAADSNFFSFFDFPLIHGNAATALKGMNMVVISSEMAKKYFGNENPVGKTLLLGKDRTALEVTGVTAPQATNVHFNFDFLLSIYTNPAIKDMEHNWIWTQVVTYIKLKNGARPGDLEKKLITIAPKHAAPILERWGMNYEEFLAEKGDWSFFLQPVRDIHLHSAGIGNRLGSVSDGDYMYIFAFTALFVLILAVINFINLSTARAAIRAKEVGVRKVLGSMRGQLMLQFLIESIGMCFLAGLLGLGITEFLKIIIEKYLGTAFHMTDWYGFEFYSLFIGFIVLLGTISGLYPAFYLTAFKPGKVLKGQLKSGEKSRWFRNALVVLQFSISTALMICTFVVYQQLNFFTHKDLGYDKENMIVVKWADKLNNHLEKYQHDVLNHPDVVNASVSMDAIGRGSYEDVFSDESTGREQPIAMMKADFRQLNTMGLKLKFGRFFEENNKADEQAIVINESTMKLFGYTEDNVLGQRITYAGDNMGPARVIGVVKDFNFYSLHYPIAPYIFFNIDAPIWGNSRVLTIKTKGKNPEEILSFLQQEWNSMVDDVPFDYAFLDKEYENQYQTEQQLGSLFAIFTCIAMVIACLGLFGLASYMVGQRSKEIGVRKTLGASVTNIMFHFNGNFTKLVGVALVIALPVAWWAMNSWLEQFVYRVNIAWWVFALAGIVALLVALLTVSYQSLKAAFLNPVDTLRDE